MRRSIPSPMRRSIFADRFGRSPPTRPRTARYADKMAVVRSLSTRDDNHDVSGYWLLTGYPYGPGSARQIKPTDWPYFGSLGKMLKPSERMPAPPPPWTPATDRP